MDFKILCVIISLVIINILIVMSKIYSVLTSVEIENGTNRPVFVESNTATFERTADWRVVRTIGWMTGVSVLILEFVFIFDALQCLLFPLKAYFQSCCILSSFCFASALPFYELQMSLFTPSWLNDTVHCARPPENSPFCPPWNTYPPFTASLMPPYGSPTSVPLMNPTAGPPMSPTFFPPSPSGGFPLFCADLGRFPPSAYMQQQSAINLNPNFTFNTLSPYQRATSPARSISPFRTKTPTQSQCLMIDQ